METWWWRSRMSVDQPAEINLMRPGLTAEPLSPEEAEQQQEILKFSAVTALEVVGRVRGGS